MPRSPLAILTDNDSFATSVFFAACQLLDYDLDALAMDPEALLMEIRGIAGRGLPEANAQKLLAASAIYFTDLIYENLESFISAANLFTSSQPASVEIWDPADILESCWLKFEIELIDGGRDGESLITDNRNPYLEASREPESRRMQFCEEIRAYVGAVGSAEGAIRPLPQFPEMLLPNQDLYDPSAPEMATLYDRHRELVDDISEAILSNATQLFSQLSDLQTPDKRPLVSAKEAAQILDQLKRTWAVRKDYFGA